MGSKKKTLFKKSYDLTRKFQTEWLAKLPWCEGVLVDNDFLHRVRYIVCSTMGKKPKFMAPKWHTLLQHDTKERHKQNLLLYAARQPLSILEHVQGCNSLESKKKWIQFTILFQIFFDGRPMCEFFSCSSLYEFLHVRNMPPSHWSEDSGWLMVAHIYSFVKEKHKSMIQEASFLALTTNESTLVDNTSWIVVSCM